MLFRQTLIFLILLLVSVSSLRAQQPSTAIDSTLFPSLVTITSIDSSTLKLQIAIQTNTPYREEYHWQIRIVHLPENEQRSMEKLQGNSKLTKSKTVLHEFHQDLTKNENILVYAFLLDRDYVIDQLVWDLSEQNLPKAQIQHLQKQQQAPKLSLAPDGFDLGGLVFNETRTRFGRDFFALFQQNWRPPTQTEAWWITIKEYPTQGRLTLISVSLNNRELFQRLLSPRREQMEDLVVFTVQTLQAILSQGAIEGLYSDEDLHGKVIESQEIEEF